jgi:uncharacterized protein YcfJ
MTSTFKTIALAAVTAGAVALPAGGALAGTSKTESALLGGLLGAVAGAAIGHGKGESVALGAVAGAAIGVAADASNDRDRYDRRGYVYRDGRTYHRSTRTYAPRYGYRDNAWSQDRYGYGSSYGQGYSGYGSYYDYRR